MKQAKTEPINQIIERFLQQRGLSPRFKEQEVFQIWPEVVGGMIASRSRILRMTEGRLFVEFTSSVVRQEVAMVKEGIVRALNDRLGDQVVKELIIR